MIWSFERTDNIIEQSSVFLSHTGNFLSNCFSVFLTAAVPCSTFYALIGTFVDLRMYCMFKYFLEIKV